MGKKPIYDAIKKYTCQRRFHMPGHSGQNIDGALFAGAGFDITELPFSDNLNCPASTIKDAEALLAKAYGAESTLMFASGATSAVHAALFALRAANDRASGLLFVEKNCHKSVFSGIKLFDFEALIVENKTVDGVAVPLTLDQVKQAVLGLKAELEKNGLPKNNFMPKAFVLTSPDYLGRTAPLEEIYCFLKSENITLLTDSAHGAHFAFSPILPPSAVEFSDLTVLSLHKTMPVLTGGAVLLGKKEVLAKSMVYRAQFVSSSPNYSVLASIDYARDMFESEGRTLFENLKKETEAFQSALPQFKFFETDDFSRIVFDCPAASLEKIGVYPEMSFRAVLQPDAHAATLDAGSAKGGGGFDGNSGLAEDFSASSAKFEKEFSVLIANPINGSGLLELAKDLTSIAPSKPSAKKHPLQAGQPKQGTQTEYNLQTKCDAQPVQMSMKPGQPSQTAQPLQTTKNTESFVRLLKQNGLPADCAAVTHFEFVDISKSIGRLSALDIGAYPPGVPQVLASTRITFDDAVFMEKNKNTLFNLVNGKVCVIIEKQ